MVDALSRCLGQEFFTGTNSAGTPGQKQNVNLSTTSVLNVFLGLARRSTRGFLYRCLKIARQNGFDGRHLSSDWKGVGGVEFTPVIGGGSNPSVTVRTRYFFDKLFLTLKRWEVDVRIFQRPLGIFCQTWKFDRTSCPDFVRPVQIRYNRIYSESPCR